MLPQGSITALIGRNGTGKSTLLRAIAGLGTATGEIRLCGKPLAALTALQRASTVSFVTTDKIRIANLACEDVVALGRAPYTNWIGRMQQADRDIVSRSLSLVGMSSFARKTMDRMSDGECQRILIARALAQDTPVILLDEPTNNLDLKSVVWLEDFLMDYEGTVLVVSHDRYFLNNVCTHIVDIDYGKIKMYVGNYDFWYESSQMMQRLIRDQNKKKEEKIKELQEFVSRFSANKSKSKQATARRKLLEKITLEEIPASSRRYPWVAFSPDREVGKDILFVTDVSKTIDGVKVLDKVSFIVGHGDKIAFVGDNENAQTALFQILTGELEPDEGTVKWGQTATFSYFPKDNTKFFKDCDDNLVEWLRQWSSTPTRPICGVSWAGCSSPATRFTSPSRCSPAARRCGACSPG